MKNPKFILISVVVLSLLGWTLISIHAHAQFDASTAGVRFSDQKGQCQIEVIKDVSFTLVVFDTEHENAHKSKMDPLTFCHKVQVPLDTTSVEGSSLGWSKKIVGADYAAVSTANQIRYRVSTA
jgi:hypothetical protein